MTFSQPLNQVLVRPYAYTLVRTKYQRIKVWKVYQIICRYTYLGSVDGYEVFKRHSLICHSRLSEMSGMSGMSRTREEIKATQYNK